MEQRSAQEKEVPYCGLPDTSHAALFLGRCIAICHVFVSLSPKPVSFCNVRFVEGFEWLSNYVDTGVPIVTSSEKQC